MIKRIIALNIVYSYKYHIERKKSFEDASEYSYEIFMNFHTDF